MTAKVFSNGQVGVPPEVLDRWQVRAGEDLLVVETPQGLLLRPRRFRSGMVAPLAGDIDPHLPSPDFEDIRHAASNPKLRN